MVKTTSRLLKIRGRQFHGSNGLEKPKNMKFDHDSGLAYAETIQRGVPMRAEWIWQSRGLEGEAEMYRKAVGAPSLRDTAIRCVCTNTTSLTAQSLETVPWQVGADLWAQITRKYKCDSFHTWKAFAVAYAGEEQGTEPELKFREHVVFRPHMSLPDYIKPATAPSFEWITLLTLNDVTCSRTELVNISKLSNLGALTIGQNVKTADGGLDDSLLRAWARAAAESSSFTMLRVLACRKQRGMTNVLFQHISHFPVLSIFVVEGCGIGVREKPVVKSLGWRYKTGQALTNFLIAGGCKDDNWSSVMHALFIQGSEYCTDWMTAKGVEAVNSLPLLGFDIGGRSAIAVRDGTRKQSTHLFHRPYVPPVQEPNTKKRRLSVDYHGRQPPKRRDPEIAKRNLAGKPLTEFGF